MTDERNGLYIGAVRDSGQHLVYDPADLTTHAVIVGMTGSGKTGLGIDILEEALLRAIPCLIIDPKGDMGNLLLSFPDLQPSDFRPWIDEAAAAKEGLTPDEKAEATAAAWREGLAGAGIDPARISALREKADFVIYTPGSTAGVPLNVLGSLAAPELDWESGAETIRDEIEGLVSSLLAMAGIDADPVSSKEHILLSTLVETSWREGRDLDLATLVGQVPEPPLRKLGVFDIDTFYPEAQRTDLAMKLNGLLASPSFSTWLEGEPLDIGAMLEGGDRTRAAIVYIAHLSDPERQFLVTLLLSKLVTWFRSRTGTTDLRALVYMDEITGFAPPTAEPPSKKPILTILKQARAYGVGMVLSTQNPVDLDYKAMSNAGTWLVGRLQTENDKKRILEGLASAAGGVDVAEYDKLISALQKRQFLLHTAKGTAPVVFDTRFAMSYLAGPLSRDQVGRLMSEHKASTPVPDPSPATAAPASAATDDPVDTVPVMPQVAAGVATGFLDPAASWAHEVGAVPGSTRFRGVAAAIVDLLYDESKADFVKREKYEVIVDPLDGIIGEATITAVDHDPRDFAAEGPPGATFAVEGAPIADKSFWAGVETGVRDHLVTTLTTTIFHNAELSTWSRSGETRDQFLARCLEAAEDSADRAVAKLTETYAGRIARVKDAISKAEARVADLEADASSRTTDEVLSGAGELLGALLGGRKRSNPLGQAAKRRSATQRAKARADTAAEAVTDKQEDLADLEDELAARIADISDEEAAKAEAIEEVEVALEKVDVAVVEVRLVWVPS